MSNETGGHTYGRHCKPRQRAGRAPSVDQTHLGLFSPEDRDLSDFRHGINCGYLRTTTKPQKYAHHEVARRMGLVWDRRFMVVDHINRNMLDNRRENLRIVSRSDNSFNSSFNENCLGVYKDTRKASVKKPWVACLYRHNVKVLCKKFPTLEEALAARKDAKNKIYE